MNSSSTTHSLDLPRGASMRTHVAHVPAYTAREGEREKSMLANLCDTTVTPHSGKPVSISATRPLQTLPFTAKVRSACAQLMRTQACVQQHVEAV